MEQPLSNSIKFLSALDQEMKWAGAEIETKKKRSDEGKKKIQVENSVDNGDNADSNVINLECGITLKAVCTMSTEEVLKSNNKCKILASKNSTTMIECTYLLG